MKCALDTLILPIFAHVITISQCPCYMILDSASFLDEISGLSP